MNLDEFINSISSSGEKPRRYSLSNEVSGYMYYVNFMPSYESLTVSVTGSDSVDSAGQAKVIVLDVSKGINGKTFSRDLAYLTGAISWDLTGVNIGNHYFSGALATALGLDSYSSFIMDLTTPGVKFVIDAFSKTTCKSECKKVAGFLQDILRALSDSADSKVICITEGLGAQNLVECCKDIPLGYFEITLPDLELGWGGQTSVDKTDLFS